MCYRVTCSACGKITWGGCGAHVDSALRGVPEDERCRCREAKDTRDAAGSSDTSKSRKENWS